MTTAADAPTADAGPDAPSDAGSDAPARRARLLFPALVVLIGACSAWASALPAPASPGAARVVSAEVLLAVFDALLVLGMAAPTRARWSDRAALLLVGLPFHVVLAAGAGASPGHAVALATIAAAFGAVASLGAARAGSSPLSGAAFALLTFGLPAVAYVLGDLLGVAANGLFLASPLTGAVLLARTCTEAGAATCVPSVVAALLWSAVVLFERRLDVAGRAPW